MSTSLSQHFYQPVRRDEDPRTITSPALILSKQILQGREEHVCVCGRGVAVEFMARPLKKEKKKTQ